MLHRRLALLGALSLSLVLARAAQEPGEKSETPSEHDEWLASTTSDGRLIRLTDVSDNGCLRCHASVGEEWRYSTHASAWQDERYKKELKSIRREQKCWGCHIPAPLAAQGWPQKPAPRAEHRHLGVDCVACHLDADGATILGPWGHETDAHPTRASELFGEDDNTLCVSCHATSIGPVIGIAQDFVDTEQADLGLSCIGCHMEKQEKPVANDPEGVAQYPARRGRSHRMMTPRDPAFLRKAFLIEAERREGKTVLTFTNDAGHRVPGLMKRALILKAKLFDAGGELVAETEHTIDNRAYLPVEEELELVLDGVGATLELVGLHEAPGIERPVVFLERTFEVE